MRLILIILQLFECRAPLRKRLDGVDVADVNGVRAHILERKTAD